MRISGWWSKGSSWNHVVGAKMKVWGWMRFGSAAWGGQDAWALIAFPAPQSGDTPLQLALARGKGEVVKILREAGALE